MSIINFENASLLALTQESKFFGNVARYANVQKFNIEGNILSLTNGLGVTEIVSGISGFLTTLVDYQNISINGLDFGSGRILSANFDKSNDNWVQSSKYNCQIETYNSGDLSSLISPYYTGITFDHFQCINTFTEDFNYSDNLGKKNYTHNVSMQLYSGNGNPITLAKQIATQLFNQTNLTGFINNFPNLNKKKFYTESYNQITNQCSWNETVELLGDSGYYSHEYTDSTTIGEDGNVSLKENGTVKGLVNPRYQASVSGMNEQKPLIFPRISGLFNNYYNSNFYPLFTQPITQQYNLNALEGTVNYSVEFSNSPKFNSGYSWEYVSKIDESKEGIFTINEQGKVAGLSRKTVNRYPDALSGYALVVTGIKTRCNDIYQAATTNSGINLISSLVNSNQFEGSIDYDRNYSNDVSILSVTGIKKVLVEIQDSPAVFLANKFLIFNYGEILQNSSGLATTAKRSISLDSIGTRGMSIDSYVEDAKTRVANYINYKNDSFVQDVSFNLNPFNNNFSLKMEIIGQESGLALYNSGSADLI